MKSAHAFSTRATCLTIPPKQSSLAVGVCAACSSCQPSDGLTQEPSLLGQGLQQVGPFNIERSANVRHQLGSLLRGYDSTSDV